MQIPTLEQLPGIADLLTESGLRADDLAEQDLSLFRYQGSDTQIDAVGGLERCGEVALLRSVATSAALRGRGVARAVVEALEVLAAQERFEALYLLTESAEGYFESRGYHPVDRSSVPEAVQASRQFSSLCPDSAVVMCKRIRFTAESSSG